MALDTPQGEGGGSQTEDLNGPKRAGQNNGQLVRQDGIVWRWDNRLGWSRVRSAAAPDFRLIPPAQVALDPGFDLQEWQRDKAIPDWAEEPAKPAEGAGDDPARGGGGGGGGRTSGGGGGGGGADRARGGGKGLAGVPGGAMLWKVGDKDFIVIDVPGANSHIMWEIPNKKEYDRITRSGRIKPDRTLSRAELRETGAIKFGITREISNTDKHPWDVFRDRFRAEVKVKPWLKDPEMLSIHAAAWIEKKSDPSIAEIQATEWWRTHTPEERGAMERYFGEAGGKPVSKSATFKRDWELIADQVEKQLIDAGYDFAGNRNRVINHYTRELLWGRMTKDAFASEVTKIANPFATDALRSAGLTDQMAGACAVRHDGRVYLRIGGKDYRLRDGYEVAAFGKGAKKVGKVNEQDGGLVKAVGRGGGRDVNVGAVGNYEATRALILEHIGPQLAQGWSKREIAAWAQKINENEEAQQALIEKLRGIREARYPGYDRNLTYEDIATVGRAQVLDSWRGRRMDEKNPIFQKVLQMNDAEKAAELLRREGRARGVRKVVHEATADMLGALNGTVRR